MTNLESLKTQYEKLGQEIKRLESEPERVPDDWVPDEGEYYLVINSSGEVVDTRWDSDYIDRGRGRLALGNVHHPSKRAELERMIAIKKRYRARVKELGGRGFVQGEKNFYFSLFDGRLDVEKWIKTQQLPNWLYVPTREAAEKLKAEFSFEEVSLMLRYLA